MICSGAILSSGFSPSFGPQGLTVAGVLRVTASSPEMAGAWVFFVYALPKARLHHERAAWDAHVRSWFLAEDKLCCQSMVGVVLDERRVSIGLLDSQPGHWRVLAIAHPRESSQEQTRCSRFPSAFFGPEVSICPNFQKQLSGSNLSLSQTHSASSEQGPT